MAFLLTDGTIMCQGNQFSDWWKLTPDNSGKYVDGTWTRLADLFEGYGPNAFGSAVLADGRLVIIGGEFNLTEGFTLTNQAAIYDPVADKWSSLAPPDGWNFIGEVPSTVLPDGRFVIGNKLDTRIAALDPATLTWTELGYQGKGDFNTEEGWNLLPDGSILTVDVKNVPFAERYLPDKEAWVTAGSASHLA